MKAYRRSGNKTDWILLSVYFSIMLIGWLMLYASSYQGPGFWFDINSTIGKHTIGCAVSIVAFVLVMVIDWRIWNYIAYFIYTASIIALIAVLLFGKEVKGASSWFSIFGYSVQPSEFAKLGTALGFSAFVGRVNINFESLKTVLLASSIFLLPAFLIFIQPDAGTALIYMAFFIPMFRAGLNASLYVLGISLAFIFIGSLLWSPAIMLLYILLGACVLMTLNASDKKIPSSVLLLLTLFTVSSYSFIDYRIILGVLFLSIFYFAYLLFELGKYRLITTTAFIIIASIVLSFGTQWAFNNVLKPHQQDRINVWLRPDLSDPQGALYNIIQSKTAIGSGGFSGKGFLNGSMTKLNYVPEQQTDFVFSILGEEQGFLGSFSLIVLFTILIIRITIIAERASLPFIRYYAYSMAGIIFFHFFINIGMTLGIMPVIGIPLPLMSKGGSALLSLSIMVAILLKMDSAR